MAFWVFAAAAGAGCVARCWQNAIRSRVLSSKLSSDAVTHKNFQSWTSTDAHASGKHMVEDACTSVRDMDWGVSDSSSAGEMASTSRAEERECVDGLEKTDASPLLPWPSETSTIEMCIENESRCSSSDDVRGSSGNACGETVGGKLGFPYSPAKMKNSFRSRYARAQYIKPMNSLESCLMAQLQGLHAKMEDRLPAPASSPISPLLLTDGCQIIGGLSDGYLRTQDGVESHKLHKKAFVEQNKTGLGSPLLPKVVSSCITKQLHNRSGKDEKMDGSSRTSHGKDSRSQTGPLDGTILFCLGISVGIMSSIVTKKKEVSKLKGLLRQADNLVEGLQEVLEMKESLTVKELASEKYESQDTNMDSSEGMEPVRLSNKPSRDDLGKCISCEEHNGWAGETPDSISKIEVERFYFSLDEAELEAGLERLGLNVTASKLDRKLPDKNKEGDSSTNFAVSPTELSLRLREVIQSRIEKSIQELELALENSQQKVKLLDSASKISKRESSIDEPLSVTSDATPTFKKELT